MRKMDRDIGRDYTGSIASYVYNSIEVELTSL